MSRIVRRLPPIWIIIAVIATQSIGLGSGSAAWQPIVVSGDPHTPLTVSLTIDRLPSVGEETHASVTITSQSVDTSGVAAELVLPANVQLADGQAKWSGDLKADVPVTFEAVLKLTGAGNAVLRANVRHDFENGDVWADTATLYFHAATEASTQGWQHGTVAPGADAVGTSASAPALPELGVQDVREMEFAENVPGPSDAPAAPIDNAAPKSAAQPPAVIAPTAPDGNLTITGHWYFNDRNGVDQPIKALIEILDASNNHLAWAYTGWDGAFSVTIPNPGQFKSRLYAYYSHVSMSISAMRVVPDGSFNAGEEFNASETYNATTGAFGPYADGTHDIGGWKPSQSWDGRYAWWIYNDMLSAFFYPWYCTPYCAADGAWLPDGGTAEWSFSSTDGDYFDYSKINLEGDTRNSASTIIHEYGHNIMQNVYGGSGSFPTNDCPSPHYIQYVGNWNCAWTEGWADYFSMAVRNEGFYRWASGSTLNLEVPTWSSVNWDDGEKVEGRLAGWLWDMTDGVNDGGDVWDASSGFAQIWDVVYNQNDNTVNNFYNAWVSRGHSKHHALFEAYQNTIDYDTAPTISGIPDYTLVNRPYNNLIDLWVYASDAESYDSQLAYTIQSVSDAGVGASIDGLGFLDLNPSPYWVGTATIVVKASDGAKSDTDTFTITLTPRPVFLPLIVR